MWARVLRCRPKRVLMVLMVLVIRVRVCRYKPRAHAFADNGAWAAHDDAAFRGNGKRSEVTATTKAVEVLERLRC
jgi:hypothetical protein